MKNTIRLRSFLTIASSSLLAMSSAQAITYTWDATNVTGATPPATLDWLAGGPNGLGVWTGAAVPVSASYAIIKFFADTTIALLTRPRPPRLSISTTAARHSSWAL